MTANSHPSATQRPAVLKWYGQGAGARARMESERAFCTLLWETGCRQIQEPLVWDPRQRVGLFAQIAGCPLQPKDITLPRMAELLEFLIKSNRTRVLAAGRGFLPAAGACFSVQARLDKIARLVAQLARRARHPAIVRFIGEELEPAWQVVSGAIQQRCSRTGLQP